MYSFKNIKILQKTLNSMSNESMVNVIRCLIIGYNVTKDIRKIFIEFD